MVSYLRHEPVLLVGVGCSNFRIGRSAGSHQRQTSSANCEICTPDPNSSRPRNCSQHLCHLQTPSDIFDMFAIFESTAARWALLPVPLYDRLRFDGSTRQSAAPTLERQVNSRRPRAAILQAFRHLRSVPPSTSLPSSRSRSAS